MEQSEDVNLELQIHVELIHFPFPLQSPGQKFFVSTSGIINICPWLLLVVELYVVEEVAFFVSSLTAVSLHKVASVFTADEVAIFTSSKI